MVSLREWRSQRALSQDALAKSAGVTKSTIIDMEHGRKEPQMETMRKVSKALGVAPFEVDEFRRVLIARGPGIHEVNRIAVGATDLPQRLEERGWAFDQSTERAQEFCIRARRTRRGFVDYIETCGPTPDEAAARMMELVEETEWVTRPDAQ